MKLIKSQIINDVKIILEKKSGKKLAADFKYSWDVSIGCIEQSWIKESASETDSYLLPPLHGEQ